MQPPQRFKLAVVRRVATRSEGVERTRSYMQVRETYHAKWKFSRVSGLGAPGTRCMPFWLGTSRDFSQASYTDSGPDFWALDAEGVREGMWKSAGKMCFLEEERRARIFEQFAAGVGIRMAVSQ